MANKRDRERITTGEFAESLAASGLFDSADVLPESVQLAPNGAAAARELVAAGKLTGFQADAVLEERYDDLRIGNYEILDRLGAGGMGTVFKARHRRMKRIVALKVLSVEAAGKFAERFQREVETIARLSHPNIVMAFDADECEAGPFLVMEFVNGRDLSSEVAQATLSVGAAIDRVLQAGRGLEYAHAQGIVHRDIKPGNILRDKDGVVKVADLGLARLSADSKSSVDTSLTTAGTVVGTVDYMPPEQAMGLPVDHRADIYSLGYTLYYLLTGGAPYQAATILGVMLQHRDAPLPNLRASRPDVPPELDAVFRRMVAKAPADRYQSMTEVVRALEQVQARIAAAGTAGAPDATAETAVMSAIGASLGAPQNTSGFELGPVASSEPPAAQPGRTGRAPIVLVEPSRVQIGIIRRYLEQLGAGAVHATGSGREALELAKRERAGVIVSSMHLNDMTGTDLARAMLADPGCSGMGFVLATSASDAEETGAIPDSPRVVVMHKPFDPQRLGTALAAVSG